MESILDTAQSYPDEPVLQLACGFLWLFDQTPDSQSQSQIHLARAESMHERLNPRELAWLRALRLWHGRQFEAAARAFEALLQQWPNDLLAVKAIEFIYYILGQQESGPRFRALTDRLSPVHQEDPDFLAIRSFAHELCGDGTVARQLAERALEITPQNPWAQHALEHLLLWVGSSVASIQLMESWLDGWNQAGRIIHCHNAWHVALTHLDRLNAERAFAIYDGHVWGKSPDLVQEQLDGIAFLWRAEMAGIEIDPARYRVILPHILPLADTLFMPFVTAHYAYAFARTGEEDALTHLLAKVDERAQQPDEEARRVWAPVGRAIIHGVAELGRGNGAAAAEWFDPAMPRMMCIGGSDAQDDLFRFAYWESLRQAGRKADAKAKLNQRLQHKPASPLEQKLLGDLG